jgi:hypothetical protein
MIKYCIYESDKLKENFRYVDKADNEDEGRAALRAFISSKAGFLYVEDEAFKVFLFKGGSNITGKLVLEVGINVHNRK